MKIAFGGILGMKKHRVGIVGFGWVAGAHLNSFKELDAFEPVAVMTRRKLDPAWFRREYGVELKVYDSYEKFLDDPDIDIVDICTPHPFHADQTVLAAEAGRDLIIEKPIALTFEDACRMLQAVEKHSVRTSVCFEARFISVAKAMKSAIDQGLLGEIYYAECDYFHGIGPWYRQFEWNIKREMGGSSLLTAGCHSLDMLLWLTGGRVEEVYSCSTSNPHPAYHPYEYDTTSVTLLRFENELTLGKVASVTDCMQPYVFNMNMVGSHGSFNNNRFYSKKIEGLNGWSTMDVQLVDSGDVAHHPYREQFSYFAECLEKNETPHNDLHSAFETHRVIFAADRSAATRKPVRLSEFKL